MNDSDSAAAIDGNGRAGLAAVREQSGEPVAHRREPRMGAAAQRR
ncbi:MAG: hypothetical protein ABJA93_04740 [Sporichthyaceae bacterium]